MSYYMEEINMKIFGVSMLCIKDHIFFIKLFNYPLPFSNKNTGL